MAHFAQLDENNVVINVLVTDNNDTNGDEGYQWLLDTFGGTWVKTSYNAASNGFRKIFAQIGGTYDDQLDCFIPKKPYNSWVFDLTNHCWVAPISEPSDGKNYKWDENSTSWIEIPDPE